MKSAHSHIIKSDDCNQHGVSAQTSTHVLFILDCFHLRVIQQALRFYHLTYTQIDGKNVYDKDTEKQ